MARRTATTLLPPAVWQSLTFEWLWVYHGQVPRSEEWSAEITVPAGWFWVEKGLARIQADGREVIVKAGQSFSPSQALVANGSRLAQGFCP